MATTTVSPKRERMDVRKVFAAAALGGALAVLVNVVLWALMRFVLAVPLQIQMGGPGSPLVPLPILPVIIASFAPAFGAAVLLLVLGRLTARPQRVFLYIAVSFLLLSLLAPFSMPIGLAASIGLDVMHIGAAIPIVWALVTRTRSTNGM